MSVSLYLLNPDLSKVKNCNIYICTKPNLIRLGNTLVMIYNARGKMSLVWALGKNTSPGREVGVNPNLLYFVITYAVAKVQILGRQKLAKTVIVA